MLFYIVQKVPQGIHIISYGAGRPELSPWKSHALCPVIRKSGPAAVVIFWFYGTGYVILYGRIFMISCQLIHKCLKTAVMRGYPFTSYDKYMLCVRISHMVCFLFLLYFPFLCLLQYLS